ncbi:MAG: hypothetical protein QOG17_839 [Gammaproteobacteria bacterium]|jgi:hypothetical protein|nr:hypothetical protein [Gammaproteobacteria bacterium]
MSTFTTITVPDIGDFKHIPVIEILVKAGDRVFIWTTSRLQARLSVMTTDAGCRFISGLVVQTEACGP